MSRREQPNVSNNQLKYLKNTLLPLLWKEESAHWFREPVDPVELGLPDYNEIITEPMDLKTIRRKLSRHEYANAEECVSDLKLMFDNCHLYNQVQDIIVKDAKKLESIMYGKLNKIPDEELELPESPEPQKSVAKGRTVAGATSTAYKKYDPDQGKTSFKRKKSHSEVETKKSRMSVAMKKSKKHELHAEIEVKKPRKKKLTQHEVPAEVAPKKYSTSDVKKKLVQHELHAEVEVKKSRKKKSTQHEVPAEVAAKKLCMSIVKKEPKERELHAEVETKKSRKIQHEVPAQVERKKSRKTESTEHDLHAEVEVKKSRASVAKTEPPTHRPPRHTKTFKKGTTKQKVVGNLEFCTTLIHSLLYSNRTVPYTAPFRQAVDTTVKGQGDYLTHVSNPIDLSMIYKKLRGRGYKSARKLKDDVDLMISNYRLYFHKKSERACSATLEKMFSESLLKLPESIGKRFIFSVVSSPVARSPVASSPVVQGNATVSLNDDSYSVFEKEIGEPCAVNDSYKASQSPTERNELELPRHFSSSSSSLIETESESESANEIEADIEMNVIDIEIARVRSDLSRMLMERGKLQESVERRALERLKRRSERFEERGQPLNRSATCSE